ncbi:non-canonical purine NTP pyrophosphatase [Sporosarcina sp. P13]|uniref:XTP/dITP diphosphatase n=1 Tax=Sporosarcina sp. P13 TaxID=2048263 RepID=UPI000C16918C|nr:XTP/dITP diphosphatase [Sporosarcina sp. P13]PIC62828.1 non-canonical purine NTP pyrophosphatase [Sporosarcina sp. P13]
MKEVLIATNNLGKARDFETLFLPLGIKVLTLQDVDGAIDVEETGTTFVENAVLKAETVAMLLNKVVIADDSGLEVDALNGEPGVYSARYAGEPSDDETNIDKLLTNLANVAENERQARFRCVLAIAGPSIATTTYSGSCEGVIASERQGRNGFGYDPVFYIPDKEKTMAQLTAEEKSEISHRGAALAQLKKQLPEFLEMIGEE